MHLLVESAPVLSDSMEMIINRRKAIFLFNGDSLIRQQHTSYPVKRPQMQNQYRHAAMYRTENAKGSKVF